MVSADMSTQEQFELEQLIDKHGIETVLEQIAEICTAKAMHIRESYSDVTLAREWMRTGDRLALMASKITVG
jgi:hypothetical protein